MAKKVLTPEEVQAKLEKKAAKRKLFFGTFTKALAFFLAIAMVYTLAIIAFTPETSLPSGNAVPSNNTSNGFDDYDDGSASTGGSTTSGSTDGSTSGDTGSTGATNATADAVKILNTATAKAAKGNYKWERKCYLTNPIDVGNATGTLNDIIHRVDENASLDSVVGGFLGVTGGPNDPAWDDEVKGGQFTKNPKLKSDYLMKAFALTESDVTNCKVNGNTYTLTLKNCSNPQKDGSNALNHVTNDFITLSEVQKGVADALGSLSFLLKVKSANVEFSKITVVAEIDNGNLKSVQISYFMDVKSLELSVATGKGAGNVECKYSNFS